MKMNERMRKVLSILLAFSMLLSYVPMPALAEEGCSHHVHNKSCGYVQGADCKHVHGEGCGDVTVTKCVHTHGVDGCTYTPGTPAVSCHPEHNGVCGYAAGASCGCDLSEGKAHVENCGYVAEAPCNVIHGADCGCAAAVPASGECNHSCTAESGCVKTTFVCAHVDHDETCGYVQSRSCTFDPAACGQCALPEGASEPALVCDCGTDDPDVHATNCPVYVAPETAVCYCQIKCTEVNVWCDVCGFDISWCGGADKAVTYEEADGCQADINITVKGDDTAKAQGGVYALLYVFMTGFGEVELGGLDGDNRADMINGVIHIPYPSGGMTFSRFYLYPIEVPGYTVTMTGADEGAYYESHYPLNVTVTYTKIPEKYAITISDDIKNGTVQADVTEAAKDETVTLTIDPNSGYELDTIAVNPGDVSPQGEGNTRTFTMPAADVTVTASFKLISYEVKDGVLIVRTNLTELPEESFDSICVESGGELALSETVSKPVEVKAGGKISSGTYSAAVTNAGTIEGVRFSEGASVTGTEPVSVIHSVDGVDTALAYNVLLKSALQKTGYIWQVGDTKLTDTDKVPLIYTAYSSAVCTHEETPVDSTACPDCGAAIEKVTTFDISPANDGKRNDYAALKAAFDLLYACPYTSGDSITVTGSREVDQGLTLCIPEGVSVDWKARLTSSSNALNLFNGAGSFTLSDGLIKAVDYNGIALANDFAGSFTITGGIVQSVNDVGIVSNGSHITIDGDTSIQSRGVAIGLYGAASVSVTGGRVSVNSEGNRGFFADNNACKVTVSGDSHLTVTGSSIGHMPTPGEGETAFFRSGGGAFTTAITSAASYEIVTGSHLTFNEETTTLTCGHGVSIPVAASVTADGTTTYYEDLSSALRNAATGSTVKLLKGITTNEIIHLTGNSWNAIALDLNGQTVQGTHANAVFKLIDGKNVTLKSSVSGGTIVTDTGWGIQVDNGKLTIEDGATVMGDSSGVTVTGGELTVNGGLIKGLDPNNGNGIAVSDGSAAVNSGTITGGVSGIHTTGGTVTVTDGSILGEEFGIYTANENAFVTVNGGTLKGPYALYTGGQVTLNGGTLEGSRADIQVAKPFTVGDLGSANYTLSILNEYALPLHIATAAQGTTPKPGWFSYVTPTGTADSDYMFVEGSRQVNGTALIQGGAANELYLYHCEHVYGEHNERRQEGVCSQCGTQFAAVLHCAFPGTQESAFTCGYTSVDAALAELDRVLGTNAQAAAYLYVYQDYTGDIAIELPGTSTIRVYFSNHTLHGQLSFAGLGQIYDIKINNPDGYGVKMLGDKRLMIYENVTIESGADAADIWLSQGGIGQCQSSGPFTVAVEDVPGPGESRRVAASSPVNINYLVSADPSLTLVQGYSFIQLTHRLKSVTPLLGNVEATYDDQTGSYSATYNANAASLEIKDHLGNPLSLGTDYTVQWKQGGTTLNSAPSNPGTYTYTITGIGAYAGVTHTGTLEITKVSVSNIYWNNYPTTVTYNGRPLETPDVDFRMPGNIEMSPTRILWQAHDAAEDASWNEGTPTDAGRYKLRAMLDESQNYMSGWSTRNVEILPAELTVSVTAAAREYNGETAVELTATLVGLEGSDDVKLPNEGRYTGTVESADAGGNKAVTLPTFTIEGKDTGNYTLTQPTGVTVTISPRAVTPGVTLSPAKLTYNGKEHTPTVTVKDGTTLISASEYTVTYTNNQNAGTATVTITDKTGGNYILAEQRKTFTIDRAAVTITAENKTAVVGDTQPALTCTVTGLIAPDKLTTAPTLACMADMDAAGTYAITVTGGDAGGNYTIQRVNGALTVKAMHTVTVNAGSNGTVSISPANAVAGAEITITVTPKSGYKMATITVKDANGDSHAVSTDNKGKYYFTMPDANATVTVTFSKISTSTADSTNPKTGDDLHILLYGSLLAMSLAGLTALFLASRKRRRKV